MESGSSETRISSSPSTPVDAGRFAPGAVLANRYRVVSLAGRGGMGEVYRADDQRLGQTVALKFLPASLEHDPDARDRLIAEVRNARTVSHPNVCRVYDVGELDGRYFLTMEYIDGEDLASLLRRIGRLPATKALEVARQLCAGLGAAHDRGLLHRDLKPANVMVDGRGQVRITDFGLATESEPGTSPSDFAGTVAYMAPERFQGQPATVQSDLYALGLILYETYTGQRPFKAATGREWQRAHTDATPANPSALISEIEPAVERAVMRCLEKAPAHRPPSAGHVAALLPGGDPLAAALAAGETPSPALVAASGEEGTLSRATAWRWLATSLTAVILAVILGSGWHLTNLTPSRDPVLQIEEAREILSELGHPGRPVDSVWWFRTDETYMQRLLETSSASARFSPNPSPAHGALIFCYRQSSLPLLQYSMIGELSAFNPPPLRSDDAYVELGSGGGLRHIRIGGLGGGLARPSRDVGPPWPRLFAAAGLDIARFTATAPKGTPTFASDTHLAWEGQLGEEPLRVEGAAHHGWVVEFRVLPAFLEPGPPLDFARPRPVPDLFVAFCVFASIGVLAVLARRNARMGRGDRKGALRIAVVVFVAQGSVLLLNRHWTFEPLYLFVMMFYGLGLAFTLAGVIWLYYLGLEPAVRREWPHQLIAWARLLDGRWRDPLVGRSLLAGTTAALCATAIVPGLAVAATRMFALPLAVPTHRSALGPIHTAFAALVADRQTNFLGVFMALFAVVVLLIARLVLKHGWAAWAVTIATVFGVAFWSALMIQPWVAVAPFGVLVAAAVYSLTAAHLLARYGLLACAVFTLINTAFLNTPITYDATRWYAARTLLPVGLAIGCAVWGFRNVLGRQAAFPGIDATD
jgi:predicted Ser/Thr protein kinase